MEIEVVVEIPQGSRNKYEMDHAIGRIRLDRMLFTSTCYPRTTGSSRTRWPRTATRWTPWSCSTSPPSPAAWCWPGRSGVFWMHDEHGPDAKVLTVPARDPRYDGMRDLADVPGHLRAEIGHFFDIYKELEPGKGTDVRGWQDRAAAEQVIERRLGPGPQCGGRSGEVRSFRGRPPGPRVGDADG